MKTIITLNPATGQQLAEYTIFSQEQINETLQRAKEAFYTWREVNIDERGKILKQIAKKLLDNKELYATLITKEMGKTISSARSEIEKCAMVCNYYAINGKKILEEITIPTEASRSYVKFEPLGVILAVMPWNFPFWQAFRAFAPGLMAGNVFVLKHASNTTGCALAIEALIYEVVGEHIVQALITPGDKVLKVIGNEVISAVTLTGSEEAGSAIASEAGKHLKKVVMELGGSDAFIVHADADIKKAILTAAASRLITSGQTCISAKRFIVHESIHDEFVSGLKKLFNTQILENPLNNSCTLGPLSSQKILNDIDLLVNKSKEMGARIIAGGKKSSKNGNFYEPTLITQVEQNMPIFTEETFGPVAAVLKFNTLDEALRIANNSKYGLAATIFTKDKSIVDFFVNNLECGNIFINTMVKSDPRLPFGGIKKSGFGRELGEYGMKEFCNVKSIWID